VQTSVDRVIQALAKFPNAKLLIAGLNETDRISAKLARLRGTSVLPPGLDGLDIARTSALMAAADILVHPALTLLAASFSGHRRRLRSSPRRRAGMLVMSDRRCSIVVRAIRIRLFLAALEEAQICRQALTAKRIRTGRSTRAIAGGIIVDAAHSKVPTCPGSIRQSGSA
jgi:hypothetical protein